MRRKSCAAHANYSRVSYGGYDFVLRHSVKVALCRQAVRPFVKSVRLYHYRHSLVLSAVRTHLYLCNLAGSGRMDFCVHKSFMVADKLAFFHRIARLDKSLAWRADMLRKRHDKLLCKRHCFYRRVPGQALPVVRVYAS